MSTKQVLRARSAGVSSESEGRSPGSGANSFLFASVTSALNTLGIVFLASEPGMGRLRLSSAIADAMKANDAHVMRLNLKSDANEVAANRLVSACRDVSGKARRGAKELLCVESIPVFDEHDVMRVSRALRRLGASGASALVITDIENEMLVEALPEAGCYRSYLLLDGDATKGPIGAATGGIPALVRGFDLGASTGSSNPSLSVAYLDALADLVALSLRDTLTSEERTLRSAMLLLGSGDYAELAEVTGSVDHELMSVLARDAPLFGVDPAKERFACIGVEKTEALLACIPRMLGVRAAELAPQCAEVLMRRNAWRRALAIAQSYLTGQDIARFVGRWGVEMVQVGGTGVVERGCEVPDAEERPLRAPRLVLSAVTDVRPSFASLPIVELTELGVGRGLCAQRARLVCLCRKVLRDCSLAQGVGLSPECPDQMSLELLVHITALRFMATGEMTNAFHLLLVHREGHGETMSSELLRADFRLARALAGDVGPMPNDDGRKGADSFFARSRMRSFRLVSEVIDACVATTEDEVAEVDCESIANRADRLGDTLTQVVAMCVSALTDLRRGYWTRATVRSELANRLALRADVPIAKEFSAVLGCIAAACNGEDVDDRLEALDRSPAAHLPNTALLVGEAIARMSDGVDANREPLALGGPCPTDERWALKVLSSGIAGFSELLIRSMPFSWRKVIGREQVAEIVPMRGLRVGAAPEPIAPLEEPPQLPVRICVLGGVSVRVNGTLVEDKRLRARRAKSFLAYLASTRSHAVRRHELMEAVWPECDYDSGLARIYQSTCTVRGEVRRIEFGLDPFVLNKKDGTIALDESVVSCDVDEYREVATRALELEGSDEEIIRLASRASELYTGDLYVPVSDISGVMEMRRRELRDMHADMMVGASEAAMRLGRTRMAARYADNAMLVDGMREDAMEALLRSYDACGRRPEAHVRYVSFVRQLAEREGRPPSGRLRRLAEELWGPDANGRHRHNAG